MLFGCTLEKSNPPKATAFPICKSRKTLLTQKPFDKSLGRSTILNRTDTLFFKNFYIAKKDRRVLSACKIRSRHGGFLFLNVFARTPHFSHAKMRLKIILTYVGGNMKALRKIGILAAAVAIMAIGIGCQNTRNSVFAKITIAIK